MYSFEFLEGNDQGGKRTGPMSVNPPIGVLLSEEELTFIYQLLISLRADDLITEDARCAALKQIEHQLQDIRRLRQDPDRSSVSQRSTT